MLTNDLVNRQMQPLDYYQTDELIVVSLSQFRDVATLVEKYAAKHGLRAFWRGQKDHRWPLTSSLVRRLSLLRVPDDSMLNNVEDRLLKEATGWIPALQRTPFDQPLAQLAYMQHHFIPTRLLDFTSNPWVALFFAAEDSDDIDGRVFGLLVPPDDVLGSVPTGTPWRNFNQSTIKLLDPITSKVVFPRVEAQHGLLAFGRMPSTQPYRGCLDPLTKSRRAMLAEEVRRTFSLPFAITGKPDKLPKKPTPPVGITLRIHVDKESVRRDLVPREAGRRISPKDLIIDHKRVYPDAAGMVEFSALLQGLAKGVLTPE